MLHDSLADVISAIKNAEKAGKKECSAGPATKMVREILQIMQKLCYIGSFEFIEDGRGGRVKIELIGRINSCGIIKPRFPVKATEYEKWEKRFLPAADVGILIVSTSKGMLSHREVRGKLGGTLIAYVY